MTTRKFLLLLIALVMVLILVGLAILPRGKPKASNYPNFSIQFIDDHYGWIIGPRLLLTADRGTSWSIISYAQTADIVRARDGPETRRHSICFVDRSWGWRISPGAPDNVQYTENSGLSWNMPVCSNPGGKFIALAFVNRLKGWLLGERVFMTCNSAKSWKEETALSGHWLNYPFLLDEKNIWFANRTGTLASTRDGGENWQVMHDLPKQVKAVFFLNPSSGWIVGDDGLMAYTDNGGSSWSLVSTLVPYDEHRRCRTELLDVFFLSSELGWACGDLGLIMFTRDGGKSWSQARSITQDRLSCVRFVDSKKGWAVGGTMDPFTLVSPGM